MKKSTKINEPCVYILKCKDNTLYTGWTNDFKKRLNAHQSGKGAKYTKGRGPLIPVYLEYLPDKISATKREAAIKKLNRRQKEELLNSAKNSIDTISELEISYNTQILKKQENKETVTRS